MLITLIFNKQINTFILEGPVINAAQTVPPSIILSFN
jgi:hypothetical protein